MLTKTPDTDQKLKLQPQQVRSSHSIFHSIALTISYVTIVPLARIPNTFGLPSESKDSDPLAGLSKYLPVAGIFISGLLVANCLLLSSFHTENLLRGLLLCLSWLYLTGGLHLDGLMDTADGISSHQNKERMIEIMSDSRVGNFGVMVGVSTILIRSVALACLPIRPLLVALLVIPAWARWCETYAIGRFPYLKKQGKGKIWHDTTQFPGDIYKAALAPFITTLVLLCSGMHIALLVSALTILAGVAAAHWLNHKLGGQTGDTYGAVVELSETVALLAMALLIQPAIF